MSAEHTPEFGPWRVDGEFIFDADGVQVAFSPRHYTEDPGHSERRRQLIASAPELKARVEEMEEALVDAQLALDWYADEDHHMSAASRDNGIRAFQAAEAISKALAKAKEASDA